MSRYGKIVELEDYGPLVGGDVIERIREKARKLRGMHVAHVNSTYYGGGVAEMLGPLTLLMNNAGVKAGWRVLQGAPDFFSVTKKMHNALQGGEIDFSSLKKDIYESVVFENALRNHLDHDAVIVHDPQPLPMIAHYGKRGPWIWRCHLDMSAPHQDVWNYLKQFVERYDAMILSIPEYRQEVAIPQLFFSPAIDPFSIKNREMSEEDIAERLGHYHIPTDLPLLVQISRFDRWKDPEGVIDAFQIARKEVPATLVLLGNVATDDPEGERVYQRLIEQREERIIILSRQDTALVNALQRRAAVIVQKSLREGFGLTVTEAMWKGAAVIGGDVGGIRHQIEDGKNGYLVNSTEMAAERMVDLLRDEEKRRAFGELAREKVKKQYLMSGALERYLDLLGGIETIYRVDVERVQP